MNGGRTQAIILRRTNYGEADRILRVLTPQGQKSLIAKGVRREKSKLAGGIELFAVSDIVIHEGRGDLGILTSARLKEFYSHIMTDYDRLQFGYYALKDIDRMTNALDEPEFFDLAVQALVALNTTTTSIEVTELWYRLQAAILLGVGVNLATDGNGMKLLEDTPYRFDIDNMAFIYDERGQYTSDHIKVLRVASAQNPGVVAHINKLKELVGPCLTVARAVHE